MTRPLRALLLAAAALGVAAPAAAAFDLERMDGTYQSPVHVSGPPGDGSRLLVVEQEGTIELLRNETGPPSRYLDITDKVRAPGDGGGGEEGLLSMAFASAQRFYVFYTAGTGAASELVVEAYDVDADGNGADEGSADEIIRIPHPVGRNHNGGQLQIGPDGNLWISTGDGGGVAGDSDGDAQDNGRLLGKILRIAPGADGGYSIPSGNPWSGGGGAPEVWAGGLRNPWRFSFDRATGDMLIGDVGESTQEEISHAAAPGLGCGSNFGWPWFEGNHVLGSGSEPGTHHAPLITHTQSSGWRAITGGYVIRDAALGADIGRYVYGDIAVDALRLYDFGSRTSTPSGEQVEFLVSFGEDGVGRVHAISGNGTVDRLVEEGTGDSDAAPPITSATPSCGPPAGSAPADTTVPPAGQQPAPMPGAPPSAGTPLARPPRIFAGTRRRQRALRRRRVFVRAGCDTTCTLRATGRLAIGRARFRLRGARATAAGGQKRVLRMRLGRRAVRAARRALRRRARVRVLIRLRADTPAGTTSRRSLTVRVIR